MHSSYIGIDNGLGGGIVMLSGTGKILWKYAMPVLKVEGGKEKYDLRKLAFLFISKNFMDIRRSWIFFPTLVLVESDLLVFVHFS